MSVESMAIALNHSRAKGAARTILIGIANHDGDGGAWPSVSTLARYANVSRSAAQRAVAQLEQLHEVRRHVQAGGLPSMAEYERPNRYEFLLTCPPDCDRSRRHRTQSFNPPELDMEDPAAPTRPGSAHAAPPAAPTRPEPSFNPPSTKTEKKSHVLERARATCGHALVDDRHCTHGCRIEESA